MLSANPYALLASTITLPDLPYSDLAIVSLASIGLFLLWIQAKKISELIDVSPNRDEWKEIKASLSRIPDPRRLEEHYSQINSQGKDISILGERIHDMERRVEILESPSRVRR